MLTAKGSLLTAGLTLDLTLELIPKLCSSVAQSKPHSEILRVALIQKLIPVKCSAAGGVTNAWHSRVYLNQILAFFRSRSVQKKVCVFRPEKQKAARECVACARRKTGGLQTGADWQQNQRPLGQYSDKFSNAGTQTASRSTGTHGLQNVRLKLED